MIVGHDVLSKITVARLHIQRMVNSMYTRIHKKMMHAGQKLNINIGMGQNINPNNKPCRPDQNMRGNAGCHNQR